MTTFALVKSSLFQLISTEGKRKRIVISGHVNSLDSLTLRTLLESNGGGNLRQIRPILDKTIIASRTFIVFRELFQE